MTKKLGAILGMALFAVHPALAQEETPLVTGKAITPQGKQINVGSFPVNMIWGPAGEIIISDAGFRQYLSLLDSRKEKVVSQISVGKGRGKGKEDKNGLYYGLALAPLSPFGTTGQGPRGRIYVSRGAEDRVAVHPIGEFDSLEPAKEYLDNPSPVPGGKFRHHIAGIALDSKGERLYAVNNQTGKETDLKGSLSILDVKNNKVLGKVILPGFPYAVAAITDGPNKDRKVYVSSERDGVVSVVDPQGMKLIKNIPTGEQPIALLVDQELRKLYVANAGSDTVSVINTDTDAIERTILLRPDDFRGLPGATPTSIALSYRHNRLFVTLADMNAVAVVNLPEGRLAGYIPTGWYPTSVLFALGEGRSEAGRIYVANAKGVNARNPNGKDTGNGKYIQDIIEGTVSIIDVPNDAELKRLTAQTLLNNRVATASMKAQALLKNPGIKHVIYIIKENRTYDQVLGDMAQGNGDPSLCMFPRAVTPNLHALTERFVLFDNFYDCAEVSADGWNWSTSGMANEYVARNAPYNYSGRGRVYDFEGTNNGVPVDLLDIPDVAKSPGGYIWDSVLKKGLSLRNYGFFISFNDPATRLKAGDKTTLTDNTPNKKALIGRTDVNFREFDMAYPESDGYTLNNVTFPKRRAAYGEFNAPSRLSEWRREFDEYVKNGDLPSFQTIRFGADHTTGTSPGFASPRAMVADNDFAVGQLVEAVSHSPYWKSTAIFVLEDDAQNGFDHVDAHRSISFVISPYIKPATVDHHFYNTDSVLHTMELLLGLTPMCQYDAIAPPMKIFGDKPVNDAPYTAILPDRSVMGEVNKATAYRANDSMKLNFARADAVPDDILNDILWHAVMGNDAPKPPVRYGLRLLPKKDDND